MAHCPLPYSNPRLKSFGSLRHEDWVVPCTGDARTAKDALNFLLGFLDRFPVYEGRPFWIAGESYGGDCPGISSYASGAENTSSGFFRS